MDVSLLLTDFYVRAQSDNRITVTHISLYMGLMHEMVCIDSGVLLLRPYVIMSLAKISSRMTYHRCMRDLHSFGYIDYCPSFRPGESKVRLIELK